MNGASPSTIRRMKRIALLLTLGALACFGLASAGTASAAVCTSITWSVPVHNASNSFDTNLTFSGCTSDITSYGITDWLFEGDGPYTNGLGFAGHPIPSNHVRSFYLAFRHSCSEPNMHWFGHYVDYYITFADGTAGTGRTPASGGVYDTCSR